MARISNYMPQKKLRIIIKAFLSSQFTYCPPIWMFHSRKINHKINKLLERALRIVYNHFSSFKERLSKDKSIAVHQRNLIILQLRCVKHQMHYPQIIFKTFLKLKVTTIIFAMRQHFPQEILKQLDMDYRSSLTWLQKFGIL